MNEAVQPFELTSANLEREHSRARTKAWPQNARVMGLGHVFLGDDGFGSAVIETFRCKYACGPAVEVLDLGTPGLDLAPYLYSTDLVILADCVEVDAEPGSLRVYREGDIRTGRTDLRLTAHDPGLQECLVQLKLVGRAPSELLIVGVVPESCDFGQAISSVVVGACATAADTIACLLADHGIECLPRRAPVSPNVWWLEKSSGMGPGAAT